MRLAFLLTALLLSGLVFSAATSVAADSQADCSYDKAYDAALSYLSEKAPNVDIREVEVKSCSPLVVKFKITGVIEGEDAIYYSDGSVLTKSQYEMSKEDEMEQHEEAEKEKELEIEVGHKEPESKDSDSTEAVSVAAPLSSMIFISAEALTDSTITVFRSSSGVVEAVSVGRVAKVFANEELKATIFAVGYEPLEFLLKPGFTYKADLDAKKVEGSPTVAEEKAEEEHVEEEIEEEKHEEEKNVSEVEVEAEKEIEKEEGDELEIENRVKEELKVKEVVEVKKESREGVEVIKVKVRKPVEIFGIALPFDTEEELELDPETLEILNS